MGVSWEGKIKIKIKINIFVYIYSVYVSSKINTFVVSMLVTPCNALGCGHYWNQACLVQPILILVMPMPLSV
jgi:hypothetical protein